MNTFLEFTIGENEYTHQIVSIGKALSSQLRVEMLHQIYQKPMTITELSHKNLIPNSTTMFHLKILEEAKLVTVKHKPNKKGLTQIFFINFSNIKFFLHNEMSKLPNEYTFSQSIPVGEFSNAFFFENCRIVTKSGLIRLTKYQAFDNIRKDALMLSTVGGSVTYSFSNEIAESNIINEINFSLELSSEAPNFRNDWKSDITFYINDIELFTYTAPGDYGGVAGKLTPNWWHINNSQFGDLVNIRISNDGVYLNNQLQGNHVTLKKLDLKHKNAIHFRLENKKNAIHMGGFNIFGKDFGNYPQDIVMDINYKKIPS